MKTKNKTKLSPIEIVWIIWIIGICAMWIIGVFSAAWNK
jgi:hypothetical protein